MRAIGWRPAEIMAMPWDEALAEIEIAHALENGR